MAENYLTLLIVGGGFLVYFLIITYGPYLCDIVLNNNKEIEE